MKIFTIILLTAVICCQAVDVKVNFAWKQLDYVWDTPEQRKDAIKDGLFVPENNLPLGVARWKNKIFISMPRWRNGLVSALNYIDIDGAPDQPLKPYPSLADNLVPDDAKELPSNRSIISVFRVFIDPCDRLWVQDNGLSNILGKINKVAIPSIAIFDLNTDELIHRHFFSDDVAKQSSFFGNIVVEVDKDACDNAFAYVPDLSRAGIAVYDLKRDISWRVEHLYFHLEPLGGIFNVSGLEFQWSDNVLGLALSELQSDGYRTLYFHALSSTKEFSVSTKILRSYPQVQDKRSVFHEFKYLGDRGQWTQSAAQYYDTASKVLIYTQVSRYGIACWNTKKPFTLENNPLVLSDTTYLDFPADLKVDSEGTLWTLSDRLPTFFYETLDPNEVNFRILSVQAADLIAGTTCQ